MCYFIVFYSIKRYKKSLNILPQHYVKTRSVRLKKIDYRTMKIEVDFVESVVYVRSDQKRESSFVGILYIHACIYVKKVFCSV